MRWQLGLFAAGASVVFLVLATQLVGASSPGAFVASYPFFGGDAFDWLLNAFTYRGFDVRFSGRPPLFPALLAILDAIGALVLAPILGLIAAIAPCFLLFQLVSKRHGPSLALLVSSAALLNPSWLGLSVGVMADLPAAALLFAALFFACRALNGKPRALLLCGLFGGLSAVTQQAALLLPPLLLAAILFGLGKGTRRQSLRQLELWLGLLLFALPMASWTAFKLFAFGAAGDVGVRNWSLLQVHFDALGFYGWSLLSFLGLPGLLLAGFGSWSLLRRRWTKEKDSGAYFLLLATVAIAVFFALLYDFQSKRFLAYVFLPLCFLAAEGISNLLRTWGPGLSWAAALLFLATSAQPQPGPIATPAQIALWPVPPVALSASLTEGRPGLAHGPREVGWSVGSLQRSRRWSLFHKISSRGAKPAQAASAPTGVPAEAALFLQMADDSEDRYALVTRLGAVLRKRVTVVPFEALNRDLPRLQATFAGRVVVGGKERGGSEEVVLFQVEPPGIEGTWMMAARPGTPAAVRLHHLSRREARAGTPDVRGLAAAREIARAIPERRNLAALLPPKRPEPSFFYLPFLLQSQDLFVVRPEGRVQAEDLIATLPLLSASSSGPVSIERRTLAGRPWTFLTFSQTASGDTEPPHETSGAGPGR